MRRLQARLAALSAWRVTLSTVLLAALVELVTAAMRFGIGLEASRDTSLLGHLTFGIRIHHGYVGVLLLLAAWLRRWPGGWRKLIIILGSALVLSDLVHHFLVLWSVTGSPELDLVYPRGE